MEQFVQLLPLILIVVVFYFLAIRPARARQKEAQAVQASLTPGQRVMTTAGLFATVASVDADSVELETSPGVRSRWAKPAVARILDPADARPSDG